MQLQLNVSLHTFLEMMHYFVQFPVAYAQY